MKRDYIDGIKEDADFFVGKEVETTPTKGMQTLFVVGLQRTATVLKHAENNKCKHIYFLCKKNVCCYWLLYYH